jgi:hypothetical protein
MRANTLNSPFLAYVSNVQEFDAQLKNYVPGDYVKEKSGVAGPS